MLPSHSTARVVRSIVQKPGQLAEWRIDFRNARNRLHKKFTPARFEIVLEARWHFGDYELRINCNKRHKFKQPNKNSRQKTKQMANCKPPVSQYELVWYWSTLTLIA